MADDMTNQPTHVGGNHPKDGERGAVERALDGRFLAGNKTAKMGGQPLRSGLRCRDVVRLAMMKPDARYIDRAVRQLRSLIRREIVAKHGRDLTASEEMTLQSACRHETRVLLATRWLRIGKDLTMAQEMDLLEIISTATDSRDKCLSRLGLDAAGPDLWDSLRATYTFPAGQDAQPTTLSKEGHDDASLHQSP